MKMNVSTGFTLSIVGPIGSAVVLRILELRRLDRDVVQRCVRSYRPFNPPHGTARGHNRCISTIHARALDAHHTSDNDIVHAVLRAVASELLPLCVDLRSPYLGLAIISSN